MNLKLVEASLLMQIKATRLLLNASSVEYVRMIKRQVKTERWVAARGVPRPDIELQLTKLKNDRTSILAVSRHHAGKLDKLSAAICQIREVKRGRSKKSIESILGDL